jgi:molecular chaperone GrpE
VTTNGSDPTTAAQGLPEGQAETESPSERAEADEPGELDPEQLRHQVEEVTDRYLRLAAEFENFKRRRVQERADTLRYSSEEAARTLVPVLDNLRRAVEHARDGGAEGFFVDGLQLVVREFESALERLGIVPVATVGAPFDPAVHEAIGGEESDDVERDTVIAEIQPGYRLHDRLIRPALVRVAHPKQPFTAV